MPCRFQARVSRDNIALVSYHDDEPRVVRVLNELPSDLVRIGAPCILKQLMLRKFAPCDCILKAALGKVVLDMLPEQLVEASMRTRGSKRHTRYTYHNGSLRRFHAEAFSPGCVELGKEVLELRRV